MPLKHSTKRIEFSEEFLNKIFEDYKNGINIKQLSKKYNISNGTIERRLREKGFEIYRKPRKNIFLYEIKCKKTGKILTFSASTQIVVSHMKQHYPEVIIPAGTTRSRNYHITGKYWFEDYFEILSKKEIKKIECKLCDWTGEDHENKREGLLFHLGKGHKMSPEEYIKLFPETIDYFKIYKKKLEREDSLKEEGKDYIICKICNKKFKTLSNTHLKKHNITIQQYKKKFNVDRIISNNTSEKLSIHTTEQNKLMEPKKYSKAQLEIYNYIKQYYPETKLNSRNGLSNGQEIDIFIPELNIGIEYNGLFYHTENGNNRGFNYHLRKTEDANKAGIKMIQIFEDEWVYKKDIVFSKLAHILNMNISENIIIHARKCEIKIISNNEKNIFLNKYHIQGEDKSSYNIGAFYNDELIAVMSFDNKRNINKSKNYNEKEWILSRFVVKQNIILTGIANKLFKYFLNEIKPTKVISFADRRWTLNKNDNLYIKIGFELDKITKPNYFYYINSTANKYKRLSKYGFGKKALKKKFPTIYSDNKTEWEIMQQAGYDRIWDCGLFRYVFIPQI